MALFTESKLLSQKQRQPLRDIFEDILKLGRRGRVGVLTEPNRCYLSHRCFVCFIREGNRVKDDILTLRQIGSIDQLRLGTNIVDTIGQNDHHFGCVRARHRTQQG